MPAKLRLTVRDLDRDSACVTVLIARPLLRILQPVHSLACNDKRYRIRFTMTAVAIWLERVRSSWTTPKPSALGSCLHALRKQLMQESSRLTAPDGSFRRSAEVGPEYTSRKCAGDERCIARVQRELTSSTNSDLKPASRTARLILRPTALFKRLITAPSISTVQTLHTTWYHLAALTRDLADTVNYCLSHCLRPLGLIDRDMCGRSK